MGNSNEEKEAVYSEINVVRMRLLVGDPMERQDTSRHYTDALREMTERKQRDDRERE